MEVWSCDDRKPVHKPPENRGLAPSTPANLDSIDIIYNICTLIIKGTIVMNGERLLSCQSKVSPENQRTPSFLDRMWNASPASVVQSIKRRLVRKEQPVENWQEVVAGPGKGIKMLLSLPLQPFANEMLQGKYDCFIYDAIRQRKGRLSGLVCWDIGAHIGYHTLSLASQGNQVMAFEPGKANLDRLRLHLHHNSHLSDRVKVIASAVADKEGEMVFVESHDLTGRSSGSHLENAISPKQSAYAEYERNPVRTITMDSFYKSSECSLPDVIKIDVEGAEHLVLEGGAAVLGHKPLLLIEIHHICLMFSVCKHLLGLGYQIEILDQEHASPSRCFIVAW